MHNYDDMDELLIIAYMKSVGIDGAINPGGPDLDILIMSMMD